MHVVRSIYNSVLTWLLSQKKIHRVYSTKGSYEFRIYLHTLLYLLSIFIVYLFLSELKIINVLFIFPRYHWYTPNRWYIHIVLQLNIFDVVDFLCIRLATAWEFGKFLARNEQFDFVLKKYLNRWRHSTFSTRTRIPTVSIYSNKNRFCR